MEYLKEVVHYFKDSDIGIGLDLEPENKVAVILTGKVNIEEIFATLSENVTFVAENIQPYEHLKSKYSGLNLVVGDAINTNLKEKSIDFIIVNSAIIKLDWQSVRNELKRISSADGYCDVAIVAIIDDSVNKTINNEFLEFLYAGSWYEAKEFVSNNEHKVKIYHNPIGLNEEELKVKEITDFINACEDYCKVLENYNKYSVKDFLYHVQKTLVNYYSKGFDLPNCSRGNIVKFDRNEFRDLSKFRYYLEKLSIYLKNVEPYFSNFDPYPDSDEIEEKEVTPHSLANDLSEIYHDIKSNLLVFNTNSIPDQQDAIWHLKFDWHGHTGDHWTFAVRAIHWKLQELRYED